MISGALPPGAAGRPSNLMREHWIFLFRFLLTGCSFFYKIILKNTITKKQKRLLYREGDFG
jgi:hypothetical protein